MFKLYAIATALLPGIAAQSCTLDPCVRDAYATAMTTACSAASSTTQGDATLCTNVFFNNVGDGPACAGVVQNQQWNAGTIIPPSTTCSWAMDTYNGQKKFHGIDTSQSTAISALCAAGSASASACTTASATVVSKVNDCANGTCTDGTTSSPLALPVGTAACVYDAGTVQCASNNANGPGNGCYTCAICSACTSCHVCDNAGAMSTVAGSGLPPSYTCAIPAGGCPATCSDGTQNGDETGTDCGGSCSACPVNCVESTAARSTCTAVGQELYTLTTAASGGGTACTGSSTLCGYGDGNITVPTNQWIEGECKGSRTNHPTGTADKAACLTWCQAQPSIGCCRSEDGRAGKTAPFDCFAHQTAVFESRAAGADPDWSYIIAAVNCIESTAATSTCTTVGQELYTLTTAASGGGTACTGSSTLCIPADIPGTLTASLTVAITLDLTSTSAVDTFKTSFKADMATLLSVTAAQIAVNSVSAASSSGRRRLQTGIVVDFSVMPASGGTAVAASALTTAFSGVVSLPTVGASTAGAVSTPAVTATPTPASSPSPSAPSGSHAQSLAVSLTMIAAASGATMIV